MKVLKAEHAGACYGVQRALDLAYRAARAGKPTCTLGPLIHNPQVVADLKAAGVDAVERVADIPGGTMVVRSHGVVPEVIEEARERGLEIVDATCPHVARAQKAAARLAAEGRFVVVVGEAGHPEVEGICAHARRAATSPPWWTPPTCRPRRPAPGRASAWSCRRRSRARCSSAWSARCASAGSTLR